MGERFRLRQDFDVSGFPPHAQAVLKGLKKYGMFVADNGSEWLMSIAPDRRLRGWRACAASRDRTSRSWRPARGRSRAHPFPRDEALSPSAAASTPRARTAPPRRSTRRGIPDVVLAACSDLDAARAERHRARFGFARSYSDPWAMLDAERPDAVALAVPEDATCAVASPRAGARATRCSWRSRPGARRRRWTA